MAAKKRRKKKSAVVDSFLKHIRQVKSNARKMTPMERFHYLEKEGVYMPEFQR